MTISEFSDQFDVLYNNITSNQAPGLNEYEKSVFLTKAAKEIVKNYFTANSKGNTIGQGFDDSAKRQADFSCLMKTTKCTPKALSSGTTETIYKFTYQGTSPTTTVASGSSVYAVIKSSGDIADPVNHTIPTGSPYAIDNATVDVSNDTFEATGTGVTLVFHGLLSQINYVNAANANNSITVTSDTIVVPDVSGKIDYRSSLYSFPDDVFIVINETVLVGNIHKQVIPLGFDEYTRLMSKPFKRPLKYQVWRLINSGLVSSGKGSKTVEIIAGYQDSITAYSIRYIRTPKPIIVANLDDGLTIDNQSLKSAECELDPILHEDILQRAVELAKVAWTATGQDNAQLMLQAGQRSE